MVARFADAGRVQLGSTGSGFQPPLQNPDRQQLAFCPGPRLGRETGLRLRDGALLFRQGRLRRRPCLAKIRRPHLARSGPAPRLGRRAAIRLAGRRKPRLQGHRPQLSPEQRRLVPQDLYRFKRGSASTSTASTATPKSGSTDFIWERNRAAIRASTTT